MCANRDTEDSILKSAFQHYPFLEIEESEDFKIYRVCIRFAKRLPNQRV